MPWGDEIVLWVLLSVAVVTDLKTGKIYNLLTFPILFAGLIYRFVTGGDSAFTVGLYGAAAAFFLFFPLYYFRIFGAGDVKLLMAVGAWTSIGFVIEMGAAAIIIGGVVGIFELFRRKGFKGALRSFGTHLIPKKEKQSLRIPFGPAFFLCVSLDEDFTGVSMIRRLRNERGQTMVEYLLLLAATFLTTYLMVTGPLSSFTTGFLTTIRTALQNFVQTAEYETEPISVNSAAHPSAPNRFRAVHLE